MTRVACPQCSGTDTAHECARGQCYAEWFQEQQEREEYAREQEDWRRRCEEERTNHHDR
jgi:hypothetical protein